MPDESPNLLDVILQHLGVQEYFQRFRFGGFVGKLTVFGGVAVVVIGGIALKLKNDYLIFAGLVIAALLAFYIVSRVSNFANKYPQIAMFEGAEILRWEQMKIEAKGVPAPKELGTPLPETKKLPPAEAEGEE
jgi:hypothetical protein